MIVHKSRKKAVCITVAGLPCGDCRRPYLVLCPRCRSGMVFRGDGGFYPCCTVSARCTTAEPISSLPKTASPRCSRSAGRSNGRPSFTRTISISGDNTGCGCCSRATTSRSSYGPAWFWRFDRLYESRGVKAVYLRTMGLEIDFHAAGRPDPADEEAGCAREESRLLNGCLLK